MNLTGVRRPSYDPYLYRKMWRTLRTAHDEVMDQMQHGEMILAGLAGHTSSVAVHTLAERWSGQTRPALREMAESVRELADLAAAAADAIDHFDADLDHRVAGIFGGKAVETIALMGKVALIPAFGLLSLRHAVQGAVDGAVYDLERKIADASVNGVRVRDVRAVVAARAAKAEHAAPRPAKVS